MGLKERNTKIDVMVRQIDDAMTTKNMTLFAKRAGAIVLSKSAKVFLFLISAGILGFIIVLLDLAAFTVADYSATKVHNGDYQIVHDSGALSEGVYRVQAPNGKIVTLQGPEDASQTEILAQAKSLYKNDAAKSYQISLPAGILFSICVLMLFRRILTGGSNMALFRIAVTYLSVIALDVVLAQLSLNPFYPEISLQFIFFMGLIVFIILNPIKRAISARTADL